MPYKVTLIPGDGIGPEVADAAIRAVNAIGVLIEWERVELSPKIIEESENLGPIWSSGIGVLVHFVCSPSRISND